MNKDQFKSYVEKLTKKILEEQVAPKKTFKLIRYNNIKKLVTAINSSLVSTKAKGNMLRCLVDLQKAVNNDNAIYANGTYIIHPEIFVEKLQKGLTIMGIGVNLKETTLSKTEVVKIFSKHKPSDIRVSSSYNYVVASWFDPKKIKESINESVDNKKYFKEWSTKLIELLNNHKIPGLDNKNFKDVKISHEQDYMIVISSSIMAGGLQLDVDFYLKDERYSNDISPRWESTVTFSSPNKKGIFEKKVTGKNTTPEKVVKLFDDMFNLKWKR